MVYGLPALGEANWHVKLNDSIEAVKATADAAETPAGAQAKVDTHSAATATHGVDGAIVGTTSTQTLTNKTISGSSNTLSDIPTSAIPSLGVWQSYTPTLVNFTGTVNWARYRIIGKSVRVQVMATLSAAPTDRMEVTAPVARAASLPTGNGGPVGDVIGDDVGTARRTGATFFIGSNFAFGSNDVNSFWGATLPHAWAANDTVAFNAEYEID